MLYFVGRLVEKKGARVLIEALERLRDSGGQFLCRIVGEGPQTEDMRQHVEKASLDDCVELLGSQPQERVKALFDEADVFVLPCVVAADGDRDGIPVALMEAMALGVPVVSTTVSGIPELIQSERDGILTEPGDAQALADALGTLIDDPQRTGELAAAARARIEADFDIDQSADRLLAKIREAVAAREKA